MTSPERPTNEVDGQGTAVPTGVADLPGSAAAGQYAVTERGRIGEGGWAEFPLPTYPVARFVHAGRAWAGADAPEGQGPPAGSPGGGR